MEELARDVLDAHELRLNVNENMSSMMTQIEELDAFLVSFHADHDLTKLEIPTRLADDSGKFPDAELMSGAERKSFAQRRLHGLCLDLGRALFLNISGVERTFISAAYSISRTRNRPSSCSVEKPRALNEVR